MTRQICQRWDTPLSSWIVNPGEPEFPMWQVLSG